MNIFWVSLIGYLLGNFSTSFLIGKASRNIDIRKFGSGNAGATNTFRVLGVKAGIVAFVGDALKGIAAVLLGKWIAGDLGALFAGAFAVLGHNWPVFLGFKGGKGIATSFGILIALFPAVSGILLIVGVLIIMFTRYVSLASISGAALLPILLIVLHHTVPEIVFGFILAALALYRHKSNIARLISGTENKIGMKSR